MQTRYFYNIIKLYLYVFMYLQYLQIHQTLRYPRLPSTLYLSNIKINPKITYQNAIKQDLSMSMTSIPTLNRFQRFINSFIHNRLSDTTILENISKSLQISSPWNLPSFFWSIAWKIHSSLLPFLHLLDECASRDKYLNLAVLWWKAISGNRKGSKLFDNNIAYDLLPSFSRWIVKYPLCWLYPNLHHQNVAIRTLYLDTCLKETISILREKHCNDNPINVIVLGAGFDSRSLRFINDKFDFSRGIYYYEMDLPSVMEQKRLMLARYCKRRLLRNKLEKDIVFQLPQLFGLDLNDYVGVSMFLSNIFEKSKESHQTSCHTIFLIEATLMYLESDETVTKLLQMCMETSKGYSISTSLCFADRIPQVDCKEDDSQEPLNAKSYFNKIGLSLKKFDLKPGRARHMGIANLDY